jgi:hypothetical protein
MPSELATQTRNAFEFVQKLYFEISYLIKEVEWLLQQQDDNFIILRSGGYSVTTRTSTGLEPQNVDYWLSKSFSILFCPKEMTKTKGGATETNIVDRLKLLILHIKLIDKDIDEPQIFCGCLHNITSKKDTWRKFENLMWEFSYNGNKVFSKVPHIEYEDSYCSFKGELFQEKLFSMRNSDDVVRKWIEPMVNLRITCGLQ